MLKDEEVLALENVLIKDNECVTHIRQSRGTYGVGNTNTSGYSGSDTDTSLEEYDGKRLYGRKSSRGIDIAAVVEDILYAVIYSYGRCEVVRLRPFETYSDSSEIAYDTREVYSITPVSSRTDKLETELGTYIGSTLRGVPEGKGVYQYNENDPEGRVSCDGFFEDGEPSRHCKLEFRDGSKYEGWVKNGKFEDYGKLIYPDGSCYDGYFQNGKPHGSGRLYDENGKLEHNGWWKKGVLNNE